MIERELTDYLIVNACKAALKAGAEIMAIYDANEALEISINSDNTIITEADRVSHETIKRSLSETRIPVMSEEGRNILFEERYMWDLYWLVDPLDGTREFVKRNNEFVVCIALMSDGLPLFGVIYIPTENKLYFSDPDRGAFIIENPASLQMADTGITDIFKAAKKLEREPWCPGKPLRIVVSRSHLNRETDTFIAEIKANHPSTDVLECGSSKKFCLIAEDKADVYVRLSNMFDWDVAAGHAIISAVGAHTKHLDGTNLKYNTQTLEIPSFIASYSTLEYNREIWIQEKK